MSSSGSGIKQPTPQALPPPPPPPGTSTSDTSRPGVKQPTPQALPQRSAGSSILVSPRQKGNPVLASLKSIPWEYSDIPADYGLGLTTCALFLSLKYHRLHPEYIYTRIRNLQGKFNLRVLLTMVDIPNHEDSLRELSKTSLVNNVTLILCWSAAEAARYLELYKSYEHANFAAIKGAQATSYAEKLVEFVTVPRAVNKADAVALVSTFGSLKAAINAEAETIGIIGGWGEKKVKAWCKAVDEPFRVKKAAKRGIHTEGSVGEGRRNTDNALPLSRVPLREMAGRIESMSVPEQNGSEPPPKKPRQFRIALEDDDDDEEDAMLAAAIAGSRQMAEATAAGAGTKDKASSSRTDEQLSDGIAAALAKLRKT